MSKLCQYIPNKGLIAVHRLINVIIRVPLQSQVQCGLPKNSQQADNLHIVGNVPLLVAFMLYGETIVAVDIARGEYQPSTSLINIDLTAIGHLFDELKEGNLVLEEAWIFLL